MVMSNALSMVLSECEANESKIHSVINSVIA